MSWECLLSMLSQTLIEEHLGSTSQCKLLYCFFNIIRGFIMGNVLCFLNLMLYCLFCFVCLEGFCIHMILRASQLANVSDLLFTSTLELLLNYFMDYCRGWSWTLSL